MKITKIRIGLTMPGIAESGNARMEFEIQVKDGEDIDSAVKQAKLLIAEHLSGGDPRKHRRALQYLNYVHLDETLENKLSKMEKVEQKIADTRRAIDERKKEARELLWELDKFNVLDRIRDSYHPIESFWYAFAAVIKLAYPKKEDANKSINNNTDNETEQTTNEVIKEPPF